MAGVPELRVLGRDEPREALGLRPHAHAGTMEFCLIERGSVTFRVGARSYEVRGGQVFCAWPDEPHSGFDDALPPGRLWWWGVKLPPRPPRGWLGLPTTEAGRLHGRLSRLPRRVFAAPVGLVEDLERLLGCADRAGPLDAALARATLVTMLIGLSEAAGRSPTPAAVSDPIWQAAALMDAHVERPLRIPAIAARVGVSASHLHRRFRAETGMTPNDFYIRRRIHLARRLIAETDQPLVEIALRCGFGTSQYLSTCFRRVTGHPPSHFRRSPDAATQPSSDEPGPTD